VFLETSFRYLYPNLLIPFSISTIEAEKKVNPKLKLGEGRLVQNVQGPFVDFTPPQMTGGERIVGYLGTPYYFIIPLHQFDRSR
jgi:hypothetical protein